MALQTAPYLPLKEGPQRSASQDGRDSEGFSGKRLHYSLKQLRQTKIKMNEKQLPSFGRYQSYTVCIKPHSEPADVIPGKLAEAS